MGRLALVEKNVRFRRRPIGIGLDEDTAAVIGPDDKLEVIGSGAITVVDPSGMEFSSMDSANRHDPVSLVNIRLHVLVHGGTYDIRTRVARAARQPSPS